MPDDPESRSPLFSVIMNCYNGETYLKDAVDSVLDQTFSDFEIVFWNNQSTDNSSQIIQSYGDLRIKYYEALEHTTLGEARNLAVGKATGYWIAFLDCDDVWLPEKLEKQADLIRKHNDNDRLGLVYGRALKVTDDEGVASPRRNREVELVKDFINRPLPEGFIFEQLILKNFIPLVSAVIRKDVFFEVGGIPRKYRQAEDFHLFLKAARHYRCRAVQEICCQYRHHRQNLTNDQADLNWREHIEIIQTIGRGDLADKAVVQANIDYAFHCLKRGKILQSLAIILKNGIVLSFLSKATRLIGREFRIRF